ncbi:hypothetical protein [Haloarcula marina]|uniref:hypothetical protein n=1 Tax=Haloarcula marina TaxID=2961574 RepID=UPI0020B6C73A|nr:hypothetical protein [Halomicroarcula marina]
MVDVADSVRLSVPATGDGVGSKVRTVPFRRYLRRRRAGPVAPGDQWDEVVNDGCGQTTAITLTVESVSGGSVVGETTQFEFAVESSERDG